MTVSTRAKNNDKGKTKEAILFSKHWLEEGCSGPLGAPEGVWVATGIHPTRSPSLDPGVPCNPLGDPLGTTHGKTGKPSSAGAQGARRPGRILRWCLFPEASLQVWGGWGPLATFRVVLGFQSVVLTP